MNTIIRRKGPRIRYGTIEIAVRDEEYEICPSTKEQPAKQRVEFTGDELQLLG